MKMTVNEAVTVLETARQALAAAKSDEAQATARRKQAATACIEANGQFNAAVAAMRQKREPRKSKEKNP